ncbi:FtsW/RodA/SpoVE family cell cycle protein [Cohaesibacter gelatinilyticus]|uniref:Probable peptidoglycan glycosyltransferase FtsW n=1 Tax=Cohaesibacter gelatinilyticus TaxID=372072 RepID=A0A285NHW2_9HYPH|nr:putative peptidoglycan glycosyltransferase FtsW [Cohaesibacter gelatinilyticus]SNZ09070.1 cell division protein FtsW [Cohaesibacter gelatinilyticus]HAT87350.1 cell division protein FtsW [Hyphomicrobiales bacterium]
MMRRTTKNRLTEWWWTIDRPMLLVLVLMLFAGLVLSMAASPAVAERIGLDSFHFVKRHAMFIPVAIAIMIGITFLEARAIRRLALLVLVGSLIGMVLTLLFGFSAKGAQRWVSIAGFSLQPSEFLKPAFVVLAAWLFAENDRRPEIPGNLFAIILLMVAGALLVAQPDIGQTILLGAVWSGLFFMAGMPLFWIFLLLGLGMVGLTAAYMFLPHVNGRINRFLDPATGDTFQVDKAMDSIIRGGWLGTGPGEGMVKRILPDSHTDFIFAVLAEEFGIIVCLVLVGAYIFIVVRSLMLALRSHDLFKRLAIAGLAILFGLQAVINIAVNLQLMPAKGMTLPFISYGGSSLLSVALGMGFLLALTRRRPEVGQRNDN